jgi:protein involved in polysaccharide export with SLBB domain
MKFKTYIISVIFFLMLGITNVISSEKKESSKSDIATTAPTISDTDASSFPNAFIVDDKRHLIPGDYIRFQITEDEEHAILLQVNDDGFIDFPYVGQIKVEHRTCKEIKNEIEPLLEKEYYYKATVFIGLEKGNPIRGKVYLIGEVKGQGPQGIPVDTEFTLSKAILAAGGFTEYAKKDNISILRRNADGIDETFVVDAEKIFDDGVRDNDPVLRPDDYIYIPKSRINF